MKGTANGERGTANVETGPPLGRRDLNRLLKLAGRALLCPNPGPGGRPLPERRFRKVMAAMTPAARREWRTSARLINHVLAMALARRRRR